MNGKSDPSSSGIAPTFKVVISLRKHAVMAASIHSSTLYRSLHTVSLGKDEVYITSLQVACGQFKIESYKFSRGKIQF